VSRNKNYRLFGLTIASDLDCPELVPGLGAGDPDISIHLHPAEPPAVVKTSFGSDGFEFGIDYVARYRVEEGRSIDVHPFHRAEPGEVRLFLLGSAMGAALHQRAALPLHACAVAMGGAAHVFCGESGAGKSTLAAALHRRGLRVLSDDTGLLAPQAGGTTLYYPGFPRVKLWPDALDHFGIHSDGLQRDQSRIERFQLSLIDGFRTDPMPMRHLYVLTRGTAASIEPLSPRETLAALIDHTYRPGFVRRMGEPAEHLRQCSAVAASIAGFRLVRPWDLAAFDGVLEQVLAHMQASGE